MGGLQFWFLVVAVVLIASEAVADYDVESILNEVPEDERIHFLKYHITKGYELENVDKGNMQLTKERSYQDLPGEFSIALYDMARENHAIVDDDLLSLLGTIVCFPNGECIDVGDVGVHPKSQH